MFETGQVIQLHAPTDAYFVLEDRFTRLPIGLPVVFVNQYEDKIMVIEPKGQIVYLPLSPVWEQKLSLEEFLKKGQFSEYDGKFIVAFNSQEKGVKAYLRHKYPGKHQWHIDELRKKYAKNYSDWECGWNENSVRYILTAMRDFFFNEDGTPSYPQDYIDAIGDIALLLFDGDAPGWHEEDEENNEYAKIFSADAIRLVQEMIDNKYFVKSGGRWCKDRFEHPELGVIEVDR